MCKFFSCVVDKKKRVYWRGGIDNHHELIEIFNLEDNTDDPRKMKIARVEIVPPKGIPFYPLSEWAFNVDESIRPEWFSPAHEASCLKALSDCITGIDTTFNGGLHLRGYDHPLPEGFNSCGGDLYLEGYDHPLPEGFNSCGGFLDLRGYDHPLPEGLKKK